MRSGLVIAGAVAGLAAWYALRPHDFEAIAATIEEEFSGLKLSAMQGLSPTLLNHPNVAALLRVIRVGEGTAGPDGYRKLYGGTLFDSFADHPRIKVTAGGWTSSAAGAYQFLSSTWDETRRIMGLADFSPKNQDMAALGRIAARGALADTIAGRFESAIKKIAREWASMPGSPYGQPTITLARASSIYANAGGTTTA